MNSLDRNFGGGRVDAANDIGATGRAVSLALNSQRNLNMFANEPNGTVDIQLLVGNSLC